MATSTSSSSLDSASAENFSSAVDSVMEETSSSEPETGVRTIINSLKSPAPSQLARKNSNPPTGVKRRTTTVKADYEPKSATPTKDIRRTYLTGAQLLSLCFWFNQVWQLLKGFFLSSKTLSLRDNLLHLKTI